MQIDELLQALLANKVLNDSEKRLLSVTNGNLITLHVVLRAIPTQLHTIL